MSYQKYYRSIFLTSLLFVGLQSMAQTWSAVSEGIFDEKNPKIYFDKTMIGPNPKPAFNGVINAMIVWKDELYVGGYFKAAGNDSAHNIARWNGTTWSPLGDGLKGRVQTMCIVKGMLYVGGSFKQAGGKAANSLAQWDGSKWTSLNSETTQYITKMIVYKGDLYASGSFIIGKKQTIYNVAKWDGTKWLEMGEGRPNDILTMTEYQGELYCAGTFIDAGDESEKSIYKWNGRSWSAVDAHMDGGITCMFPYKNELCVGGYFTSVNEIATGFMAAMGDNHWRQCGNGFIGVNAKSNGDSGSGERSEMRRAVILSMMEQGGLLYVGGGLSEAGANGIAQWNGTKWSGFDKGVSGDVNAMAIYKGFLYVGGEFKIASDLAVKNIARWKL